MRIVVTGSVAYDYLMSFPGKFGEHIVPEKVHVLSVSFLVDSMKKQRGGTAANIAYTLALLGERPEVVAAVGEDFDEYRRWLEGHGVDTAGMVEVPGEFTSSCFINTDLDNNQITAFYSGAMTQAHTLTLDGLGLGPDDLVVISPNDPRAMASFAAECTRMGIPYLYDPSMQAPRMTADELRDGFKGARILTGNDYEFGMMAEKLGTTEEALRGLVPVCVVTRGGDGASIYADGREHRIPPARPREVVNPTGAGDAFRSGLVAGIARGLPWGVCGRLGAIAAIYAIEQPGTQQHKFIHDEFRARYRENYGDPDGAF
jgi:adenosine kinase